VSHTSPSNHGGDRRTASAVNAFGRRRPLSSLLQRLIGRLCASQVLVSVGPHHGHSNRPGAFTPRVWNSPDCADARWRQLRLKYVHKPTFWAAAKTLARPDQNLCSPCSDTSCVGILHFGSLGSALGTLFDSPTEALLARASLRATKPR
jgi:hypothetical protein